MNNNKRDTAVSTEKSAVGNKLSVLQKACKSSLVDQNDLSVSTSAVANKKTTETLQVEKKHQFDGTVQFHPESSNGGDLYEELAAIYQYEAKDDLFDAQRRAILAVKKLREKQANLLPAVEKYWANIFSGRQSISEYELVCLIIEDDFMDINPKNNTIALNKIFKALWEGYITCSDGPASNNHIYQLSKEYLSTQVA